MLAMAEKDLKALIGMTDVEIFDEAIFGFHVQQAVEKSLKAWIAALGMAYPFTHDISRLLTILENQSIDVESFWDLVEYNAYAVQFRYEAFETLEEPLDRDAVITDIQGLVDHVCRVMQAHGGEA